MALVKCEDCGKEVSSKAASCPNCGAPLKKRDSIGKRLFFYSAAAVVTVTFMVIVNDTEHPAAVESSAVAAGLDKSEGKQQQRLKLLNGLRRDGVFGETRCRATGADQIIKPAFYALDFDTKQKILGVTYAYCFDGKTPFVSVTLRDSLDNTTRGKFTVESGLKLK